MSKIETGRQLPTADDIATWAGATGGEVSELLPLLERARVEFETLRDRYATYGGAAGLQNEIGAAEAAAARIARFHPVFIIGLLQTADYMRECFELGGGLEEHGVDEAEIGRLIASRLRRQAILHEPGREITLLMSEGALRTQLASPSTMHAQREHIAHVAETLTTATIGIVPFTARLPVAPLGGWGILDDIVSIEQAGGDLEIADPQQVERYWRDTRLLLDVAAKGADAAKLCRRINDEDVR